jgi:hypothetical protein
MKEGFTMVNADSFPVRALRSYGSEGFINQYKQFKRGSLLGSFEEDFNDIKTLSIVLLANSRAC